MNTPTFPAWCSPADGADYIVTATELRALSGAVVPITNGIPRFVASEEYASSFGLQWNRFQRTQLDSFSGVPLTRDRLRRCIGDEAWQQLAGRLVLECGCGAGRFTEVLLECGASVMSVDLSTAVDANARNFPVSATHRVAQADIMHLPFAPGLFDVVICLGVLQHTPDPEASMRALWNQVAAGGLMVIDHYEKGHAGMWYSTKPLVRAFLRGREPESAMRVTNALVDFFYPLHNAVKGIYPLWFALCRISPITTYLRTYPAIRPAAQREWAYLDTHDSLTDFFKHERSREQILACLSQLGGEKVWCAVGGNGVEARVVRAKV